MHLVTVFVLALCGSDCSKHPSQAEFRIQISSDPVSLDPALAEDGSSLRILFNTTDGLVGYDTAGVLQPRLAESYRFSKDKKELEFTLRKGLVWSDGQPITVSDFVTGLRRSLAPETGSKLAQVFEPILRGDLGVIERDGKLVIRLSRSAPYILHALTMSQAMPEREDVLRKNRGKWPMDAPVTGPYRIVEYKVGQHILLSPNSKYWNGFQGKNPMPIRLVIVEDEATAKNLFEQGRLDILSRVGAFDLERFRSKGWLKIAPFPATYYISFNLKKAPFNDRRWRRAVAASIRTDEIAQSLNSGERVATGWVPEGIEGHLPEGLSPSLRASWLREFHLMKKVPEKETEKAIEKIDAGFDSGARNSMVMEKIQRDIEKELRIRIRLQNMDWKSYVKQLTENSPQLFRFAWMAPFRDPIIHLQVFVSGNPNNYSGWSNSKYDGLVKDISEMESGPERESKIREAQKVLLEDAALVPIYHYVQVYGVKPEVEGFIVNPFGWIPFHPLRK